MATAWKPDFTRADPYEGMPEEYARQVTETFVPTEDRPEPPLPEPHLEQWRAQRPSVPPPPAPPTPAAPPRYSEPTPLPPDVYEEYEQASPERQFEIAREFGYVPEGAKYTPPVTADEVQSVRDLRDKLIASGTPVEVVDQAHGMDIPEERLWGYLTKEQQEQIDTSAARRREWARQFVERGKDDGGTPAAQREVDTGLQKAIESFQREETERVGEGRMPVGITGLTLLPRELEPYEIAQPVPHKDTSVQGYDIARFLRDHPIDTETLRRTGFTAEQIDEARSWNAEYSDSTYKFRMLEFAGHDWGKDKATVTEVDITTAWNGLPNQFKQTLVATSPEYREQLAATIIAFTPVVGTVVHWNRMNAGGSRTDRSLSL